MTHISHVRSPDTAITTHVTSRKSNAAGVVVGKSLNTRRVRADETVRYIAVRRAHISDPLPLKGAVLSRTPTVSEYGTPTGVRFGDDGAAGRRLA